MTHSQLTYAMVPIGLVAIGILGFDTTATAQSLAQLKKYCRDNYPNSIYRKEHTPSGVRHFCRQTNANGYTDQPIDLAAAAGGSRSTGRKVDLARYCRTKYPNSIYEVVQAHGGPRHRCRISAATGGFVAHPIDLADACRVTLGTPRYRKSGNSVICLRGKDAGTSYGVYRWPHSGGITYRGQLKNGRPHGIGRNHFPRGHKQQGWIQVGTFHNGKSKGLAYTRRRNGVEFCILVTPGRHYRTRRMPLSRCAHLIRYARRSR